MKTFNSLLNLLPNKTSLHFVDYNESLEERQESIQEAIHSGSYEPFDDVYDCYHEQEWQYERDYLKELRNKIIELTDIEKQKVKDFIEKYEDEFVEEIHERSEGDLIQDLLDNTKRIVAHFDTGYSMESGSWNWNERQIKAERNRIKKHLKIKTNDYDENLDLMIEQASYGGQLLIYFIIKNPKEFIIWPDDRDGYANSFEFSDIHIGIIDHCQGSGNITYLKNHKVSFEANFENIFLEKCIKYNWTYSIAGMVTNWCDSTNVEFSKKKMRKKIEKSPTAVLLEREKRYNETFRKGSCTYGDMDINRHRNTPYSNNYPCGNRCTDCGTFWID